MKNEKLLKINLSGVVWQSLEFSLMGFSVIAGIINLNVLIVTLVGLCGLKKSNGLVSQD